MRAGGQHRLLTCLTRTGPLVVTLQSLTLWLAAWVYVKRVADQVLCCTEPDRYHRHLGFVRELLTGYPCPGVGHHRRALFRGFAYFAARPQLAFRLHASSAWQGVEELSETCIALTNATFCLATAFFPGSRFQRVARRTFLIAPCFLHHLLTLLPLLVSSPGVPSVLSRLVPLRPLFLLYFALTGMRCWEVTLAAAVTFGSTVATTVLLLRAGVPIYYQPVRVLVHVVLASLAAVAWAALWDGLLPGTVRLHRLRLGLGQSRSGTAALRRVTAPTAVSRSGGAAGALTLWLRALSWPSMEVRLAACPPVVAPAAGLDGMPPAAAALVVPGETDLKRQLVVSPVESDAGGRCTVTASAGPVTAADGTEVEGSGCGGCGVIVRKRRPGGVAIPAPPDASDLQPSGGLTVLTATVTAAPGRWSSSGYSSGCGSDNGGPRALAACPTAAGCTPLWPLSLLRKPHGGVAARDTSSLAAETKLSAMRELLGGGGGASQPTPSPPLLRQRLRSLLRREVLRIRIVGAEPEQLPDDWQQAVFGHFDGSRRCGNPAVDGVAAVAAATAPRYLVSGVAVRRGSICMTVSLVQLPCHHDGGEGASGISGAAWVQYGSGGAAAAAAAAAEVAGVGHPPAGDATAASRDAIEAAGHGRDAGEAATAMAAPSTEADTDARNLARAATGPQQLPCRWPRASARTASTGGDGPPKHVDDPAAFHHSVDGGHAAAASGIAAAAAGPDGLGATGGSGLYSGAAGPRRRVAGVWRAERHGTIRSTSPASTPGNSSNPLLVLGPAATAAVCIGSPLPSGLAGLVSPSASPSPVPGLGLSLGAFLHNRPMRYTPLLSPTQQEYIYGAPGPCGARVGSAGLLSYATEMSLPGMVTAAATAAAAAAVAAATASPLLQDRGAGPASSPTHGSLSTGGGGAAGTPSASMHVAQLLDAIQLRSRDTAMTSRETRNGRMQSALTAVSTVDGSGVALHLRQVLGTESWEPDEAVSSSWEVDGVYERPLPPPPPPPFLQQQQQHLDVTGRSGAAGSVLSPLMQQQLAPQAVATGSAIAAAPVRIGASAEPQPTREVAPHAVPHNATWGSTAAVAATTVWPSHTGGLAVLADPASLPVRDVAVKPILICKAALVHAAAAGNLAASIPTAVDAAPGLQPAPSAATATAHLDSGPDVGRYHAPTAAAAAAPAAAPPSELELSLVCAPATVSELSVMLRYCGPTSTFGEQTYLPVQLQLDSSSPAVAAAIRLQALANDRDGRSGCDTQAARDVAETDVVPLPAHATVRTALAGLTCPGVLYVELWHGPQLCACLPVLLLPESAAGWAHEVCNLWQQQSEEGEAMAAVQGRAGAAAMPAAAHQVIEDLGGWLTYAAHRRHVAERAAAAAAASQHNLSLSLRYHQNQELTQTAVASGGGGGIASSTTLATVSPPQLLDEWFSGWLGDCLLVDPAAATAGVSSSSAVSLPPPAAVAAAAAAAAAARAPSPLQYPTSPPPVPTSVPLLSAQQLPMAAPVAAAAAEGHVAYSATHDAGGACNRELFHDMMLQEGFNWLADCVEAGCCGLAAALMDSLMAAGCSASEVLRTCRSADGLPLVHVAALSGNRTLMELVWGWAQAAGTDLLGWRPQLPVAAAAAAAATTVNIAPPATAAVIDLAYVPRQGTSEDTAVGTPRLVGDAHNTIAAAQPVTADPDGDGTTAYAAASEPPSLSRPRRWGRDKSAVVRILFETFSALRTEAATAAALDELQYLAVILRGRVAMLYADAVAAAGRTGRAVSRLVARTWSAAAADAAAASAAFARCATVGASWRRCLAAMQHGAEAAVRTADAVVMRVHSLALHANVLLLHRDEFGSLEEHRFVSYFQQHHGWVFSTWCWSMVPLYALVLWRHVLHRQWTQLALTPLWMWMYVVCAAADVAGATAAYRSRTEALAACMHLSHSLSKALYCAGLPSYPVPPGRGRLYWMDVLACATLSALCEPVRICVAWPLRLVNFAVSTVLYRVTDTAPTFLEAFLLSASCHCFGLLTQHAVESQYRHSFAARQQASDGIAGSGAAGPTKSSGGAAAATAAAAAATTTIGTPPEQLLWPASPQPLSIFASCSPRSSALASAASVGFTIADAEDWSMGLSPAPIAVGTAAASAVAGTTNSATGNAAATSTAAAAAATAVAAAATVPTLRLDGPVSSCHHASAEAADADADAEAGAFRVPEAGFGAALEQDGMRVVNGSHDRVMAVAAGGPAAAAVGLTGLRAVPSGLPFLDPQEDRFLLADGLWESSDGTGGWPSSSPYDIAPNSSEPLASRPSPSASPRRLPRPHAQARLPTPSALQEQWRQLQQQQQQQQQVLSLLYSRVQLHQHSPSVGSAASQEALLRSGAVVGAGSEGVCCSLALDEEDGGIPSQLRDASRAEQQTVREDGADEAGSRVLRTCTPFLAPGVVDTQAATATATVSITDTGGPTSSSATPTASASSSAAAAAAAAATMTTTATTAAVAISGRRSSSFGSGAGSWGESACLGGARRRGPSGVDVSGDIGHGKGGSDCSTGLCRSLENGGCCSDSGSGSGSGAGTRQSGSSVSGGGRRSFRQLVSRATGWVASTLRRRSFRSAGSGSRKAGPVG